MSTKALLRFYHWDNKKWHEHLIPNSDVWDSEQFEELLEWVAGNINLPYRHARWRLVDVVGVQIKFRYERDLILCRLRW